MGGKERVHPPTNTIPFSALPSFGAYRLIPIDSVRYKHPLISRGWKILSDTNHQRIKEAKKNNGSYNQPPP